MRASVKVWCKSLLPVPVDGGEDVWVEAVVDGAAFGGGDE